MPHPPKCIGRGEINPLRAGWIPLVIVVEDSAIVALELEMVLLDAGLRVLGPASSVVEALQLLVEGTPDFGVLDFNIGGEPVTPVAVRLRQLRVPFLLTSAYPNVGPGWGAAFDGVVNLGKPTNSNQLIRVISRVLRFRISVVS